MSGIYVKVTMPELAVRLFQSAPYQSGKKMEETQILGNMSLRLNISSLKNEYCCVSCSRCQP